MNGKAHAHWMAIVASLALVPAIAHGQATINIDGANALTYQGSSAANNLTISYSGGTYTFNDTAEIINVANGGTGTVNGSGTNTVTVTNVASMSVRGGDGSDRLTLQSSSAIAISFDTQTGVPDDVVLGNGTTANILGTVTVDDAGGVGYLTIDDSAEATARTVTISANSVTGATPNAVGVVSLNVTQVYVTTGSNDDSFTTTGWAVQSYPMVIGLNGGGGSDVFNVTALTNPNHTIVGGTPVPPTSPGDQLNVDLSGVTSPVLTGSSTATGYQGTWTYTDGQVAFSEIETYTPLVASQILAVSGDGQSTRLNTTFALPLVVRVTDPLGVPVPGVSVSYVAPGSGASASLTSPAVTDAAGETQVTATANNTPGIYQVTATAAGVAGSAIFDLANSAEGIPALGFTGLALLGALLGLGALLFLHRRT